MERNDLVRHAHLMDKVFLLGNRSLVRGHTELAFSGVSYPMLMLLLDLAVEFQQLHDLGKHLGHAMPGEEALNGPLPEAVAEIPPLVHEQEHHGQDSVLTEVGPEVPG